jgi:hypothetical protein
MQMLYCQAVIQHEGAKKRRPEITPSPWHLISYAGQHETRRYEGTEGRRLSVLGSRFSVLGSRFSVLGSRFSLHYFIASSLHYFIASSLHRFIASFLRRMQQGDRSVTLRAIASIKEGITMAASTYNFGLLIRMGEFLL